ncbi:MAG TPA: POTRA domain-containing protein [Candidatus Angelobacter sp.]|nr:POTRA domain-containing protein [Candidatus Angelobacter sp.]
MLGLILFPALSAASLPAQSPPAQSPPAPAPSDRPAVGLNSLQGTRLADVRVVGAAIDHPEWLTPLIQQKGGEPLDKYKVRQSVQALYDTGRFAEIQVETQRNAQGGLDLIFDARENYFLGSIRSEGATTRPSNEQLVNATKLALGEKFTDENIKIAIAGMERVLQEAGYYRSAIQPYYEWDPLHQQVRVLFVVTRGRPARVGQVTVNESSGYTAEQISAIAQLRTGQVVSQGKASRATDRIRKKLQSKGMLESQVTLTQRTYHPENDTLDYAFEITRGPIVDVKVEGTALSRGRLKKLVPVFEENAVDEDLLNEGARNIRDYEQTQGYFGANVTFSRREAGSQRTTVVFQVVKDGRKKFADLMIEGNRYFHSDDLRERMRIHPAGGLLVHGIFSQSLLARDIQTIEALYRSNGFLQVKVSSTVNEDYRGQSGLLQVVLTIAEGPQTTVGKLTITGNTKLSEQEIRALITASEGEPYSDTTVSDDQTEVMNAYANRGFPEARFEYTAIPDPGDPNKVDLSYNITEGGQIFVNSVLVAGLHYTRPFVVDRELKIKPNAPLGQSAMLESQSRLYDLGLFNEVDVAVQNPEGQISHKNVNFQLSEARRYIFDYGFGLEVQTGQPAGAPNPQGSTGVSPRVSFDVTRLNFRGRDQTLTLNTRYGNLEKLALVGSTWPRFFGSPAFTLSFTAFYEQTKDVATFTANRLEGVAEIKQILNRASTILYRLVYRRVSTANLVIAPESVPLFSQPVRVGMPDLSYIRDTRDNPIDSHKGTFNTFDVGVASNYFASETNFARLVAQNSTYYQFHKRRWVFARSTRIGIEEPYSDTSVAISAPGPGSPPPSSFIPLPERFFAGGSTSMRGFGINQAGPRDLSTGQPLGGEAVFLNNLELRTPPLPFPYAGNNVSAVIFHDMGNVFTTPSDMLSGLYKFTQPGRSACLNPLTTSCNFNYMSHAVGSGIRYRTPIGPVSLDLGYNLNPPAFPIGSQNRSDVLKHWNFFFNIGQTF